MKYLKVKLKFILMKIIYTPLTFDIPHYAHYNYIKKCNSMCDKLYVGLHNDYTLSYYKRNSIYTMEERKIILESCKYVDKIILNAPLSIDNEFIIKYNIDLVIHAHSKEEESKYDFVFKKIPKNKRLRLDYDSNISTSITIKRIFNRIEPYLTSRQLLKKYGP